MEPKNGGLEDNFPFQLGDFLGPAVNFPGFNKLEIYQHLQLVFRQRPQRATPIPSQKNIYTPWN